MQIAVAATTRRGKSARLSPARGMLLKRVMHRDPKLEAQITEEAGLTAESEDVRSVANPDAPGEEGIEAAVSKQKELDRNGGGAAPEASGAPRAPAPSLDRLDKERATDEGMAPPSNP